MTHLKITGWYECTQTSRNIYRGIPRFTLLMWGYIKKPTESENRLNQGYIISLKRRKIE